MRHPCRLYLPLTEAPERFEAVAYLADRLHALRDGRPIVTMPGRLTTHDHHGECVIVRFDDEAGGALGFAVVGQPEFARDMQDRLLTGALEATMPGRRIAL